MPDKSPDTQVNRVLKHLDIALSSADIEAFILLFQEDCYWRDLVSFTWNIKTMESSQQIADMLES